MTRRFALFLIFVIASYSIQQLDATDWSDVQQKVHQAISEGYFPGCVLGVFTNNATLYKKAFGTLTPTYGVSSPPVNLDTYYDLNYLTQVVGINSKFMRYYDDGRANVTSLIYRYFYDFDNNGKRTISFQNIYLHNSGLQTTYTDSFGNTSEELLKKINTLKLEYKIESKYQFSELGYVVLGQVISKMDNKTLDSALFQILVEAGLRDTKYKPSLNTYNIAPSGFNNRINQGTAGNKIANFLGSIAGNSGLYSNLANMGNFMQLMLNKGKMPLSSRIFSEEVIELFTTQVKVKAYNNTLAMGWDTIPAKDPPCGSKFSPRSFGMSDPSGSYIWADKNKNISIVLLANGQYPTPKFSPNVMQGKISDAIMTALGY